MLYIKSYSPTPYYIEISLLSPLSPITDRLFPTKGRESTRQPIVTNSIMSIRDLDSPYASDELKSIGKLKG